MKTILFVNDAYGPGRFGDEDDLLVSDFARVDRRATVIPAAMEFLRPFQ